MSTQFNRQKKILFQAIQFSQTVLIKTTRFSISIVFIYLQLNVKTVPFQTIQFSIGMQFKSNDGETPDLELWGMWSTLHCHYSQIHSGSEC